MKKGLNIAFYGIAVFYVFLMLDFFFRINIIFINIMFNDGEVSRSYNLIPFRTIWGYLSGEIPASRSSAWNNILGNVAAFIPYGLYLQVLLKNKGFGKSLLTVILTSVSIEMIQFAFGVGAADIDDVILNACGGVIGIIGYKLLRKWFEEESKTKTAITVISLAIGVPIMLFYLMICVRRYF